MNLLGLGILIFIYPVIVNTEDERKIQEGGRFLLSPSMTRKLHYKPKRRGFFGTFLSSYDSTSLKGIICRHSFCHRYGPSKLLPERMELKPRWVMNMFGRLVFCYNEEVNACPKYNGGHYVKYYGRNPRGKKKLRTFQMVVCGKIYICRAEHEGLCPDVPIIRTKWRELTSVLIRTRVYNNLIIVCLDPDFEKCKDKYGSDKWVEVDKAPPLDGVLWFIVIDGIKYYCTAKSVSECEKVDGAPELTWKRYCSKSDTEECPKDKQWQLEVNGIVIICLAYVVDDCVSVYNGQWKPSDKPRGKDGEVDGGHWSSDGGYVKIICMSVKLIDCPKFGNVTRGWEAVVKPIEAEPTRSWELRIKSVIIICVSDDVGICRNSHKGNWVPSKHTIKDDVPPKGTKWVIMIGTIKIYCKAKSRKRCPKIEDQPWKVINENQSEEDESEEKIWEVKINGEMVICIAFKIKVCKNLLPGKWKKSNSNVDDVKGEFQWVMVVHDAAIYCKSKHEKYCPSITKGEGKWQPVLNRKKRHQQEVWEMDKSDVLIICVANTVEECEDLSEGEWRKSDRKVDDITKVTHWVIVVHNVALYCSSKQEKKCPKISKGGGVWEPVSKGNKDKHKDIDNDNAHYWQVEINGVKLVCAAIHDRDCDRIQKGQWKLIIVATGEHGEPDGAIWVVILEKTELYCYAKDSSGCPTLPDGNGWVKVDEQKKSPVPGDGREVDITVIVSEVIQGTRYRQPQGSETVLLCYGDKPAKCPSGGKKWIKTTDYEVGEKLGNLITVFNVWVVKIETVHVVCVARDVSSCKVGSDWYIIGGVKASLWHTKNNAVDMYCEGSDQQKCPIEFGTWVLIATDQWSQTKLALAKKGKMWRIVTFTATIHCDAKYAGQCPKLKGYTWHKIFTIGVDFAAFGKKVMYETTIGKAYYGCKAMNVDACPDLPDGHGWKKLQTEFTIETIITFFKDIPGFEDACTMDICPYRKKKDIFDERRSLRGRHKHKGKPKRHRRN